jgi:hypothetical protein
MLLGFPLTQNNLTNVLWNIVDSFWMILYAINMAYFVRPGWCSGNFLGSYPGAGGGGVASNLDEDTGYPVWKFVVVLISPSRQIPG